MNLLLFIYEKCNIDNLNINHSLVNKCINTDRFWNSHCISFCNDKLYIKKNKHYLSRCIPIKPVICYLFLNDQKLLLHRAITILNEYMMYDDFIV